MALRSSYCPRVSAKRILYQGRAISVGEFRCPPEDRRWQEVNVNGDMYVAAFPGTSVVIQQTGRRPVLANPNHVMFYSPGERYRRVLHDARGDLCLFVCAQGHAAEAVLGGLGLDPDRRMPFDHGPSDADAHKRLRLASHALRAGTGQPLEIEEAAHYAFARSLERGATVHDKRRCGSRKSTQDNHHLLVEDAKALLTERVCEHDSLEMLARALHTSPFHLSRVFRERTGYTLHAYRTHLRLRLSLDRLSESNADLRSVAVELGFNSHSHFTGVFHSVFGAPPSEIRSALSSELRRELGKTVEALRLAPS